MARIGSNERRLALVYRGWQLGHLTLLMAGKPRLWGSGVRRYAKCSCGWEGRGRSETLAINDANIHLERIIKAADGTRSPAITEWPPGMTPQSTMEDLYAALGCGHN